MTKGIREHLELAVFFENRGFTDKAKNSYEYLINHLASIDAQGLSRISHFYHSIEEYKIAFQVSKLALEKSGEIQSLAPLYFSAWEQSDRESQHLNWLLNQPGMEYMLELKLKIVICLFELGQTDKAYRLSLEILDNVDRNFRQNPSEYLLYIDTVLHMVEIEYSFKNYNQARFHLRKAMYLPINKLERAQKITYWAILLDEISSLVSRQDWDQIACNTSGEVETISDFYKNLSTGKIDSYTLTYLEHTRFSDERFEMKRPTYIALVRKLRKETKWYESILTQKNFASDDLLTCLLYGDYLNQEQPDALSSFWKTEFLKHADRPEAIKAYWNAQKKVREEKKLEDCKVTFLGGGEKIGGTSILISVMGQHLLLDAGMHLHGETFHPDYNPMFEEGITFKDIDALLISHAHLDHTGAVPYVHALNPTLPIFATEATSSLMKILLSDTVKVGKDSSAAMYDAEEVQRALFNINNVDFYEPFTIQGKTVNWRITYYPSGHILGAGSIHIEVEGISILFTGDYSIDHQKTVKGLDLPPDLNIDILITESTYGFLPTNASIKHTKQESLLVEAIEQTLTKGGSMLIPAFAVGRAQEIILILKDLYKKDSYLPFNLFIDGRVTEVCRVYERFAQQGRFINPDHYYKKSLFLGKGVQAAQDIYSNSRGSNFTFENFMDDYIHPGNNCIVASSGMLADYSSSARYAEQLLEENRNTISFTGYLDEESPGHHILHTVNLDESPIVKINGVEKKVQASIESFRLSAHASREQILQLILGLQPKKVFLMHGEHDRRYNPAQTIVAGEKIYPTLIDLLSTVREKITVIPAFNGETYHIKDI